MLAPLATAVLLSVTSPANASTARPILLAENSAPEAHPSPAEASATAAPHAKPAGEPSRPRGDASGQNPTGAPKAVNPWNGVGADGVSGMNQR